MNKTWVVAGTFLALFLHFAPAVYAGQAALCSMHDGKAADGKTILEKQGKKYEFCCSGCLQRFKDSPEQFVNEMRTPVPSEPVSPEAACSTACSD